jgi:hypothetical protein
VNKLRLTSQKPIALPVEARIYANKMQITMKIEKIVLFVAVEIIAKKKGYKLFRRQCSMMKNV